jgi:alpha-1,6-mannosyltransferase
MKPFWSDRAVVALGLLTYLTIAYCLERNQWPWLLLTWSAAAFVYVYAVKSMSRPVAALTHRQWLFVSLAFHLLFLFSTPALSDDFYRFLWDGQLLNYGMNPYVELPEEVVNQLAAIGIPNAATLYNQLNSPSYFTIYPPLAQGLFGFVTWAFPNDWYWAVCLLRGLLLVAQFGTVFMLIQLLRLFKLPESNALLYSINPLIIIELSGNIHLEVVMLFFLSCSFYLLIKHKTVVAAFFFGCAVATKLIPLMFFPLLLVKLGWKRAFRFVFWSMLTVLLCFFPFLQDGFVGKLGSSIDLYFRTFEFNASLYYLVREMGYWWKGYNVIQQAGPVISLLATAGILWLSFRRKNNSWKHVVETTLLVFSVYLFTSTTVHPWYLSTLIFLTVFTPHFRFPLLWSFTVVLSYLAYTTTPYRENGWWLLLEYAPVYIYLAMELKRKTERKAALMEGNP